MKSPSPPPAPDPAATAAAQSAANKETAIAQAGLNMTNQTDAYGNKLTYSQIGNWSDGTPRYEATQTLSPEQQALANKTTGIYGQGLDTAQSLFNNAQSSLSSATPVFDDAYRTDQLSKLLARQQPQLDKDRAALETSLANQGIGIGSQAYNDAMGVFNQRLNDLNLAADTQAGNEARSMYQTELAGRSQPINEISALLGLGQVQNPNIVNTPQTGVANTDVIGATNMGYQGALNNYNQAVGSRNSMFGGLAGLGGAALGGWAQGGFKI